MQSPSMRGEDLHMGPLKWIASRGILRPCSKIAAPVDQTTHYPAFCASGVREIWITFPSRLAATKNVATYLYKPDPMKSQWYYHLSMSIIIHGQRSLQDALLSLLLNPPQRSKSSRIPNVTSFAITRPFGMTGCDELQLGCDAMLHLPALDLNAWSQICEHMDMSASLSAYGWGAVMQSGD